MVVAPDFGGEAGVGKDGGAGITDGIAAADPVVPCP